MALPTWLARFNRRYTNQIALRKESWPVLVHKGRNSGNTYRTPLGAYPTANGFLFTVNYNRSDWPRNVVAAGSAILQVDGEDIILTDPVLMPPGEAYPLITDPDMKTPPSFVGVEQCLVMSRAVK
ncbi:MAG TPA: nitroreductase family deazaflavin-dependent oxidoreductase [Acidimicrobiia bacterium]|nr:nitroreductase family deazaflavin-dependent oxidoreductase [Acidimicrobiia bacterium]